MTPNTSQFFEAAAAAYDSDPTSTTDLTVLHGPHGKVVATTRDGFHGVAYRTDAGQVIVAFEGTDLSDLGTRPTFVNAQIQADQQIYFGANPALYNEALQFTERALTVAARHGVSADNVFVDGHSLGGAEAEYVAAKTGLAGDTFGAPGIAASDIASAGPSGLTNFVDFGDPVGNYSANPDVLRNILANDGIERYGNPTYLGDPSSVEPIYQAGRIFGQGPGATATSLGVLANALVNHHLLDDYAADLGLPAGSGGTGGNLAGVSPHLLAQVIGEVTEAGPYARPAALSDARTGALAADHADLAAAVDPGHRHTHGAG